MNRVALMFSNIELAEQLASAVDEYADGWAATPHCATVSQTTRRDQLRRLNAIRTGDYDIIQVDELVGNGPFGTLLGKTTSTPVLGYLRGYGDYTNGHRQYGPLQRRKIYAKSRGCFRFMDGIASISEAVKAGISDMYPSHSLPVLERPYDVNTYGDGDAQGTVNPSILTVTNLRYRAKFEGVALLLDALERLDSPARLHIAGNGRYADDLRALTSERTDAWFYGWVDDVPRFLAQGDVFAYASFLDGRPSTVYEAKAAGLPVVGADASGVPEAVGDAGLVCPPTPAGMAESLRAVLESEGLRERLAFQSKSTMAFHNNRVTQDWVEWWEGFV